MGPSRRSRRDDRPTLRWVYVARPRQGGVWRHYQRLRAALADHGVDLHWMAPGNVGSAAAETPGPREPGSIVGRHGQLDSSVGPELVAQARRYDGVLINVLTDPLSMNLARYLPREVPCALLVHNMTPGTLAPAKVLLRHSDVAIAPTSRIEAALRGRGTATVRIPHAVERASSPVSSRLRTDELSAVFVGRLVEPDKGVMWLPEIIRHAGIDRVSLTVVGDGPQRRPLEIALRAAGVRHRFLGWLDARGVSDALAEHDVMLMPSRFEGFGLTLIEAMAAGCVPIATRLRGVTDEIVNHRVSGFLHRVGAVGEAGALVRSLASDPDLLSRMSRAAVEEQRRRFSLERMGADYARVLRRLRRRGATRATPLDPDRWRTPRGFGPGLRAWIPGPAKNALRRFVAR